MLQNGLRGCGILLLHVGRGEVKIGADLFGIQLNGLLELGNAFVELLLADEALSTQDQSLGVLRCGCEDDIGALARLGGFTGQQIQFAEFELRVAVRNVQLDRLGEFGKGRLQIGDVTEFQICQCKPIMSVSVLRIDLDDIFKLDHGFVVLRVLEIVDPSLHVFCLLGFGGLRAASEGEDERKADGDYADRVARSHSPNLLLNLGFQDPLPCHWAEPLAMPRK